MKTLILLVAIIFSAFHFSASAQTNTSFEDWDKVDNYEDPTDWGSFNYFSGFGASISCVKTTDAHWGSYAARLTSVRISKQDSLPGSLYQFVPFTTRIKSFSAYYKYAGSADDSAYILASFFKGRVNDAGLIGSATLYLSPTKNWTRIAGDIEWTASGLPDTMVLFVNTSFTNYFDTVYVDDIEISDFYTGIQNVQRDEPVLFQNGSALKIVNNGQVPAHHLVLRNLFGAIVFDADVQNEPIDISQFSTGIYMYELMTDRGPVRGKMLIEGMR